MTAVNQNAASQVTSVISKLSPNKTFNDMMVAIGPPTMMAIANKTKIKICIINPTVF